MARKKGIARASDHCDEMWHALVTLRSIDYVINDLIFSVEQCRGKADGKLLGALTTMSMLQHRELKELEHHHAKLESAIRQSREGAQS